MYDLLKSSEVLETDGISSELHLAQDEEVHVVQVTRSELHIEEGQSGLKFYVPRDAENQEFCYFSKLPQRLVEWMMTDRLSQARCDIDEAAVRIANIILNARKAALPRLLESEGIIDIDFAEENDMEEGEDETIVEDEEDGESVEDEEHEESVEDEQEERHQEQPPSAQPITHTTPLPAGRQASIPVSPSFQSDDTTPYETPSSSVLSTDSTQPNRSGASEDSASTQASTRFAAHGSSQGRVARAASPRPQTRPIARPFQSAPELREGDVSVDVDTGYRELLYKVLNAARRAAFPSRGPFDMSDLLAALPGDGSGEDSIFDERGRLRSRSQIERDMKIGAAGELFVCSFPELFLLVGIYTNVVDFRSSSFC